MAAELSLPLENGLNLREVLTTGSELKINLIYDDNDNATEEKFPIKAADFIGEPVESFAKLSVNLVPVDEAGLVKKKILEEGGGQPPHEGCTVYIAFSGYWEDEAEPFDIIHQHKPMAVDLSDSTLLPGLYMAVNSMLVGETSVFLLSYEVMYGEFGVPPRIKPKADCVFYIKLIRSILTPKKGKIHFSEPNMFDRVLREVKLHYGSGASLYKTNNFTAAIQQFRKAVFMLHKCRLADEKEEDKQQKMLIKLYTNLAICYNAMKQPLKACTACNELNRLNSLWNNSKVLYQNAKALRMIGQFDPAEKKLRRALKLAKEDKDRQVIDAEFKLLERMRESCNQSRLMMEKMRPSLELVNSKFKDEVDKLIKNFKENVDLCKLTLPAGLNSAEIDYIKESCVRENLFFNKIRKDYALDKDEVVEVDVGEDFNEQFC